VEIILLSPSRGGNQLANFESGETVVLNLTVTAVSDGSLHDPSTSLMVDIWDPDDLQVVTAAAMTRDSVGVYHYDYLAGAKLGTYQVLYTATDGTRVTKQRDSFNVQA
jgi:hypothetical protein